MCRSSIKLSINEHFGGVFIHSCGNISHNLPILARQINHLRGLDFGATETPISRVIQYLGNVTVLSPHVGLNKYQPFSDIFDYLDQMIRQSRGFLHLSVNARAAATAIDRFNAELLECHQEKCFDGLNHQNHQVPAYDHGDSGDRASDHAIMFRDEGFVTFDRISATLNRPEPLFWCRVGSGLRKD